MAQLAVPPGSTPRSVTSYWAEATPATEDATDVTARNRLERRKHGSLSFAEKNINRNL